MLKTPLPAGDRTYSSETERRHTLFCGTQLIQAKGGGQGGSGAIAVVTSTGEYRQSDSKNKRYNYSAHSSVILTADTKNNKKVIESLACNTLLNLWFVVSEIPPNMLGQFYFPNRMNLHCPVNVKVHFFGGQNLKWYMSSSGFFTAKGNLVSSIMYPQPTNFRFYQDAAKFLFILGLVGKTDWRMFEEILWPMFEQQCISFHIFLSLFSGYRHNLQLCDPL